MRRDTSSELFDSPTLASAREVPERKFVKVAPLGFTHEGAQPFRNQSFSRFDKANFNLERGRATPSLGSFSHHCDEHAKPLLRKTEFKRAKEILLTFVNTASCRAALASSLIGWL
jgi:hypothetical protein